MTGKRMAALEALFRKIIMWILDGFAGQITLHCDGSGRVRKVETRKFERVEDE